MLIFSNTDFLTYQIKIDYVHEGFYTDKHSFEFSWCEKENLFYDDKNKKLIGKIKGKLHAEIIEEFLSLKPKIYSMKTKKGEMKKTKRVKKKLVQKDISHQEYKDFYFAERTFIHTMQSIRSFKHQIYTILSDDGLALSHKDILVCCKYLKKLSNLSETFAIYFNSYETFKKLKTKMRKLF